MAKEGVDVTCDEDVGVLYVLRCGSRIRSSRYAEQDDLLVLNLDANGVVVGFQLEGVFELSPAEWLVHPDRGDIPADLLSEADGWFRTCWADARHVLAAG